MRHKIIKLTWYILNRLVAGLVGSVAIMCLAVPAQGAHAEEGHYALGVFPYLPAARLEERFAPIAADFSRVLGKPVTLQSRDSFNQFRAAIKRQEYDIIFVQPFDYIRVAAPNGYTVAARASGDLKAEFVTLAASEIADVNGLRGKVIAILGNLLRHRIENLT